MRSPPALRSLLCLAVCIISRIERGERVYVSSSSRGLPSRKNRSGRLRYWGKVRAEKVKMRGRMCDARTLPPFYRSKAGGQQY